MPNQQDADAINGLFDRIEDVARNSPPRDRDAEALMQQRLREYPPAPYYMAQAMLVQEQALANLQGRVQELEQAARQPASGSFLGGLFGGGQAAPPRRGMVPAAQGPIPPQYMQQGMAGSPWSRPAGGGFAPVLTLRH